jgi:membrane-associated phospholipid phosphatase
MLHLAAAFRAPQLDQAMFLVTFLGNVEVIAVVTSIAVVLLLLLGRKRDAALVLVAVTSSVLFVLLLKLLVGRPRPPVEDARLIQGGFSFPSGHSAVSAVLYGTLAYLLMRSVRRLRWRVLIGTATALLVLAIGLSRVYLGVHYPSDVLAGWAVGALWVLWVVILEDLWEAPPARPLSWRRVIALVMVALVVIGGGYLAYVYWQTPALTAPASPALRLLEAGTTPHSIDRPAEYETAVWAYHPAKS